MQVWMSETAKFYVVWKGRKTGVFSSWEECAAQVQGFTGAQYKSFPSRLAAEQALRGKYTAQVGKKPISSKQWLFSPNPPVAESFCVDAACSGSPGPLEYRGVDLQTGKEIFHQGPFQNGTNNVGEFLAIVHALKLLEKQLSTPLRAGTGKSRPVYSDSSTAITWVKKKHCNTELVAGKKNATLFELIDQAEDWLADHNVANPILKWDTKAWGEIPADFNRK
jgi:ribonuclease HI